MNDTVVKLLLATALIAETRIMRNGFPGSLPMFGEKGDRNGTLDERH